ncbi:MAG: hypothetical protein GY720_20795 [bacterium]|nr:hypothetical protein [bacterium]
MPFVDAEGIARLAGAWIAPEQKIVWCAWDVTDREALQRAFDDMNRRSGLKSKLTEVETFYPAAV